MFFESESGAARARKDDDQGADSSEPCPLCLNTGIVHSAYGVAYDKFLRLSDTERLAQDAVFCACEAARAKQHAIQERQTVENSLLIVLAHLEEVWLDERERRQVARTGLPAEYHDYTVDRYLELAGDDKSKLTALKLAQMVAAVGSIYAPNLQKSWHGIHLIGPEGVGKRECLIPVFLEAARRGSSVRYFEFDDLIAQLQDAPSREVCNEFFDGLASSDMIMIRDFGCRNARKHDFITAYLATVLNICVTKDVTLLVTSTLTPYEIDTHYGGLISELLTTCAFPYYVSGPWWDGCR